jgi:hypothetical protein
LEYAEKRRSNKHQKTQGTHAAPKKAAPVIEDEIETEEQEED